MSIWFGNPSVDGLDNIHTKSIVHHLGIEFLEIGPDFIRAKMPVDERTVQPFGILHGGASIVLAETLGSMASALCVDVGKKTVVGLEVNGNHLRAVRSGFVFGECRPVHLGRSTHIWEIKINDEEQRMVCISRLTVMVLDKKMSQ